MIIIDDMSTIRRHSPRPRCPPEALVLLDEALESLPEGQEACNWLDLEKPYAGPVLTHTRCADGVDDETSTLMYTWTVGIRVRGKSGWVEAGLLEWWDDRWVRMITHPEDRYHWKKVWEGRCLSR